jgi:tetratricopeptide (TPR) repeat protein
MAGGPALDLGDIDRLDSRFKRRLATCIILVTLLSSVVGFLAADAGAREDEHAREAERNAVAAMAEDAEAYVQFYGELAGYAEAQPAELRRRVAEARELVIPGGYAGDADRWKTAGRDLADLSSRLGPGAYPEEAAQRLFQDHYYRVDLASLRQAARRATADAWGVRSERYAAILTMLAIVLAVLGLAATFGQRLWRPLVRPAVAVALGCAVLAAAVGLSGVPEVPEEALRQVAEGDRLLALRDVEKAIESYSKAVALAPEYAVAYVRRAGAHALQGSPERDQTYVFSTSDPAARARSMGDLERAFELGADDDLLAVATQAANYFAAGRYGDAEALARRATERNPRLAAARLSLGLAQAAQGRTEAAVAAFDLVAARAVATTEQDEREELFATGHATLEQLVHQEPQRADLVRLLHDRFAVAQTTADARRPLRQLLPGAAISGVSVSAAGRTLTATYRYRGLRDGDRLTWIVYTRPAPQSPWRQQPRLRLFQPFPAGQPAAGRGQTPLPWDRCPAAGSYRVDLYLEGVYQASAEATRPPSPEPLEPDADPLASFGLCRPAEWKVQTRRPGLLEVRSPATAQRLTVSVFPAPPELPRTGAGPQLAALADRLADRRGFRPAAEPPEPRRVGDLRGPLRAYQRPGQVNRTLRTWVSLGPDHVLRTVVLEGTLDDLDLFDRLLARIAFPALDG